MDLRLLFEVAQVRVSEKGGEAMSDKWSYFWFGAFFGAFFTAMIRTVMGA